MDQAEEVLYQRPPRVESTRMHVRLLAPVVVRCPGLPFSRLTARDPWSLLDDPAFVELPVSILIRPTC